MPNAIITGGTRGLGRALVEHLTSHGWRVVFDARHADDIEEAVRAIRSVGHPGEPVGIAGDIADPGHRTELQASIGNRGLDLLVNNAGALGPAPLPRLVELETDDMLELFSVNAVSPLAVFQTLLEALERANGAVVNITSDAAVEAYPGWGGYGAAKAALEQISKVLAAEHPDLAIYAFDPGDMRTDMHQAAYPDQDISDRPSPESIVPSLMRLVERRLPSGRYTESEFSTRSSLR